MSNRKLFPLPGHLEKKRNFGQRDVPIDDTVKPKTTRTGRDDDGTETVLPISTIYEPIADSTAPIDDIDFHVLTLVGARERDIHQIRTWFNDRGQTPVVGVSGVYRTECASAYVVGNCVSLTFEQDVRDIECITPMIQLNERLMLAAFIGRRENCIAFKKIERGVEDGWGDLYKIKTVDLLKEPMEEKSFLTKCREFILGISRVV